MKVKEQTRKVNYKHLICILVTLYFLECTFLIFPNSFGRVIESVRDLGVSFAYYFCTMFRIPNHIAATVNGLAKIPFFTWLHGKQPATSMPGTPQEFTARWSLYWHTFAYGPNVMGYFSFLARLLYNLSYVVLILVPIVVIFYLLFKRYMKRENNDYDQNSKQLVKFKKASDKTYRPAKAWVKAFVVFIAEHGYYWKIWLYIWLWNFNVITICIEFISYYLYFASSFNFGSLYMQVYKLFLDLSVPFKFIPWWCWVIFGIFVLGLLRRKIAYKRLRHMEMMDRGFINARPIVFMDCGSMGKKKTTMITDMALSQAVMHRDKAFEMILENDLKFPYFPWINLENAVKDEMKRHRVYNLATCKTFIGKKAKQWARDMRPEKLFGYDYERYGLGYDDKLKVSNIWDVIETYAQLYFFYIVPTPLIISNYAIRLDEIFIDTGNFPVWDNDFFKRDSRYIDAYSRHSHIIDFDAMRLGRKIVEDNVRKDSFDFGVVVITEIGKERANTLELKEVKKGADETNQKNDGFNSWLKMVRHSATIDNFPFVRVITDEQRPTSWGADARELCEVIHIKKSTDTRLAMPFFALEELLYAAVFGRFVNLYYQYRHNRSDNTLFMYIVKTAVAKLQGYYKRTYNLFSFSVLKVQVEDGAMDGKFDDAEYYLMSKKIYSKRFSTDCFSEYFTKKNLRSKVGIADLPEYQTEKATFEEMGGQSSYFINDIQNADRESEVE